MQQRPQRLAVTVSTRNDAPEVPSYPVPRSITGPPCLRGSQYGDLVLQVGVRARGLTAPPRKIARLETQSTRGQGPKVGRCATEEEEEDDDDDDGGGGGERNGADGEEADV